MTLHQQKGLYDERDIVASFETGHLLLADMRQKPMDDVGHFVFGQCRVPRSARGITASCVPAAARWRVVHPSCRAAATAAPAAVAMPTLTTIC